MSTLALHARSGAGRYKAPVPHGGSRRASRTRSPASTSCVYLAGKMIGLMAVIAIAYVFMKFIGDKALAQDADDRRRR